MFWGDTQMEIKYHIPTEQYGFIEVTAKVESTVDARPYEEVKGWFAEKMGLDKKGFDSALDRYLAEGKMDANIYEEMSLEQKTIIQCIKRSFKRQQRN